MAEASQETPTLESQIDSLYFMREQVRDLEEQVKTIKKVMSTLEKDILDTLEDQGLTKMGTNVATVSVSTNLSPTVDPEHWPDVFNYLFANGYIEVLRKQLNSGPWQELLKLGIEVPHVTPFEGKKLNLRKA